MEDGLYNENFKIQNQMKLPGILDQEGKFRDVSSLVKDWDTKNVTIGNE